MSEKKAAIPNQADILKIMEALPHRNPFLMVDRILEMSEEFVVGQKCVSANEPYFNGHFPGNPVMPGVLQLEAMAQTGAVLEKLLPENKNKLVMLGGVEGARFRRPIVPGDVMRIEMKCVFRRRNVGKGEGRITVDGELASEATLTWILVDL